MISPHKVQCELNCSLLLTAEFELTLPPTQASALDALLDDSVMFAKKLRDMSQPVSLTVAKDLPHGFLSLYQLSKETDVAAEVCVARIREVFEQENPSHDLVEET